MREGNVRDLRAVMHRDVAPDFTARVFSRIGLDRYLTAPSAIGDVYVAWRASGVTAVAPVDAQAAFEVWYAERFGQRVVLAVEVDPIVEAARAALRGETIDVPLELGACSAFEQRVFAKAGEIRRGDTRSYDWVAREIGDPRASSAVQAALAHNPVPLLVPCHRVIDDDWTPGPYALDRVDKRALLETEGVDFAAIEQVTRDGYRYIGADDDGTFCVPGCGSIATDARSPGYVMLRTVEEAHARGLVPCAACRPIAA